MNHNPHKTAITRKTTSVPFKYYQSQCLIDDDSLDFGCGKGFDCDTLKIDGFDPYYRPELKKDKYHTVFCNYVLNVLPPDERKQAIEKIFSIATKKVVISVRSYKDIKHNKKDSWVPVADGFLTTAKTFQKGFCASDLLNDITKATNGKSLNIDVRDKGNTIYAIVTIR